MRFALLASSLVVSTVAVGLAACVSDTGSSSGTPGGTDAATQNDTSTPTADAGPDAPQNEAGPVPGDVLDLDESTLTLSADEKVDAWKDRLDRASFKPTGGNPPGIVRPAGAAGPCAKFAVGVDSLLAANTSSIDFSGDFSVTLKLVRGLPALGRDDGAIAFSKAQIDKNEPFRNFSGFGLMTDYQDAITSSEAVRKFAGRFDYVLGQSAVDLAEPTVRAGDAKFVVTFAKRGATAQLLVRQAGEAATDVTSGSGFDAVTTPNAPIILGSARPDPDPATKFDGLLCAVIVHVGPETDDDLKNRVEKLKW